MGDATRQLNVVVAQLLLMNSRLKEHDKEMKVLKERLIPDEEE